MAGKSVFFFGAPPLLKTSSGSVYAGASLIFTKGIASSAVPTVMGVIKDCSVFPGTAVSFSISQALPAGMVFDTQTGQISGTPTVYTPAADYKVTMTGEKETQSTVVCIRVDFMRDWPVIQPILTAQASLGVSGDGTAASLGSLAGPGTNWYGGVLAPNGKIYGMPANSTSFLVIDTKSNGSWPADVYQSPYFDKF